MGEARRTDYGVLEATAGMYGDLEEIAGKVSTSLRGQNLSCFRLAMSVTESPG
jgi:hypothetical protein